MEASEIYNRYYDFDGLHKVIKDDFTFSRIDRHISRDLLEMMEANNVFSYKKTDSMIREYLEKYLRVLNETDLLDRHVINSSESFSIHQHLTIS